MQEFTVLCSGFFLLVNDIRGFVGTIRLGEVGTRTLVLLVLDKSQIEVGGAFHDY